MNKEEILAQARKEKHDEGKEYIENRILAISGTFSMAIVLILMFINFAYDKSNASLSIVFYGIAIGQSYGQYKGKKKKRSIFWIVLFSFVFLIKVYEYIIELKV